MTAGGQQLKRHAGCPAPCRMPIGCPKGTAEEPKVFSPQNWAAFQHYRECRATGQFPDDQIVRRNAALIRSEEDRQERERQERILISLAMPQG